MEFSQIVKTLGGFRGDGLEDFVSVFKEHAISDLTMESIVNNPSYLDLLSPVVPLIGQRIFILEKFKETTYMSAREKTSLQESYFTPSKSYKYPDGKTRSRSPTGYIQSFFKNYWTAIKKNNGAPPKDVPEFTSEQTTDFVCSSDDLEAMTNWLAHSRGPLPKVFDYLNKTFQVRRQFITGSKESTFDGILEKWLFDIDGAIQNDFALAFPRVCDNLVNKWNILGPKILQYSSSVKKSLTSIGISSALSEEKQLMVSFFMLPFLIRSKIRKMTQAGCIRFFIEVIDVQKDITDFAKSEEERTQPFVVCKGTLYDLEILEYFFIIARSVIKCGTLLAAVDLAFKCYYVFNMEFPPVCHGAWQFLDHAVFNMKPNGSISPTVNEIAAFVSENLHV